MKKASSYIFILSLTLAGFLAVFPLKTASAEVGGYVGIWGAHTIASSARSEYYDDYYYHYYHDYDLDMSETWAAGVKAGYTMPQFKYISFEFEYSYLKPDIKRSIVERYGSDYIAVEGDVKLNNFMINVIGRYPRGRFHPYIGAGFGFSYSDMSAQATQRISGVTTSAPVGKTYTSFSWQLLTGVEIDIINHLSADIGYRYFATQIEFENSPDIYFENSTKVDFTAHMIAIGLKFLF